MSKNILDGNAALTGFNDIFKSTTKSLDMAYGERIIEIPLAELHPPEFHPFHVTDDEAMEELSQSIKQDGFYEPGLVRPRTDENGNPCGYELLAGNRRKRACEIAGIHTMPVIIREMDDARAAIAMVDSNLKQRKSLLFSARAWAYRVKMEALNHNGIKGDKCSHEILMEQTGESKNQIFRLIRLTELIVGLLDMVDAKKIAFNPAVELSYLSQVEQTAVISAMDNHGIKPSHSQAVRLKKLKQNGKLTLELIDEILSETKKPTKDEPTDSMRYREYFPSDYSQEQIDEIIIELLMGWKARGAA